MDALVPRSWANYTIHFPDLTSEANIRLGISKESMSVKHNWQLSFREARGQANKYIQEKMLIAQCLFQMKSPEIFAKSR